MVNQRRKQDISNLSFFVMVVIVVNILSSFLFTRFDFTKEKRFTLSDITKTLLGNLKEDVQITIYLEGEFPPGFKRLQTSTKDLLSEYKAYSNGNLRFDFVNPLAGDTDRQKATYEELLGKGIEPTNLSVKTDEGMSQKMIYPAALISYNGRQFPVKLLQNKAGSNPEEVLNNSIQNLEYAFTSAIKKVSQDGKPRIGFTEGHGELTDLQLNGAMQGLADGYEVGRIDLKSIKFAGLDKLNLLIIPKPNIAFTEAEKYKIDYYVMRGGRVLWAVDNVNAELDSLRKGQQLAFAKKLNLDDILFKYGVRINYNLIADMNCSQIPINVGNVGGESQIQLLPWLFYPLFVPKVSHPIVKNLDALRGEFASTIDIIEDKEVKHQVILTSSPFSRAVEIPTLLSLQMVEQEPDPKTFISTPKPVGVLIEGNFSSDFKNRPVPEEITEQVSIPEKSKPNKMIVLSDGDLLKNQVSTTDGSPFPLGYDRYTEQQYGNLNFLLNIADYLTDDSGIIELRNKEIKIRLLDKSRIREEKTKWQVINIVLPLLLLLIGGLIQQYYRKQKYSK